MKIGARLSLLLHAVTFLIVISPYYEFFASMGFLGPQIYHGNQILLQLLPIPFVPSGINNLSFYFTSLGQYILYIIFDNYSIVLKLFIIIAYLFYYFILNYVLNKLISLFGIRNMAIKYIMLVIFFLSPALMEDTGSYFLTLTFGTVSLIFLIYIYIYARNQLKLSKAELMFACALFGGSFLLDPRWLVWDSVTMIVIIISDVLINRRLKGVALAIKRLLWVYLLSIPLIIFVYLSYIYGPTGIINYIAGRAGGYSQIQSFSSNSNFFNLFTFIVEWWPNPSFAPPSILLIPKYIWRSLPVIASGINTEIIWVPHSIISYIWLASLLVFPALFALSVLRKNDKRPNITLPLAIAFLFILAQASGSYFPIKQFTYLTMIYPEHMKFLGPVFTEVYATPYYAINAAFAIFFIITLLAFNNIERLFKNRSKYIPGIILVLVLFAGWQNFYPGMALGPQFGFSGNGVALAGPTTPITPPASWLNGLNYLDLNINSGVFYIGGYPYKWELPAVSGSPTIPGFITPTPPSLAFDYSLPVSLKVVGVSYLVVDNTTYKPLIEPITQLLNYTHLVYDNGSLYIFKISGASLAYYSDLALAPEDLNSTTAHLTIEGIFYNMTGGSTFTFINSDITGKVLGAIYDEPVVGNDVVTFLDSNFLDNSSANHGIGVVTLSVPSSVTHLNIYVGTVSNTIEENYTRAINGSSISVPDRGGIDNVIISPVPLYELEQSPATLKIDYLTESYAVGVNRSSGFVQLNIPFYDWDVNGGQATGSSVFGSPIFSLSSTTLILRMSGSSTLTALALILIPMEYGIIIFFILDVLHQYIIRTRRRR